MKTPDTTRKSSAPVKSMKKPYAKPKLTRHGDIVEQTTRGHSGHDKNRKSIGI